MLSIAQQVIRDLETVYVSSPLTSPSAEQLHLLQIQSGTNLVSSTVEMGNKTPSGSAPVIHESTRIPSSIRHKQRESVATLPKQPKPEHNEIERRFNEVLVSDISNS